MDDFVYGLLCGLSGLLVSVALPLVSLWSSWTARREVRALRAEIETLRRAPPPLTPGPSPRVAGRGEEAAPSPPVAAPPPPAVAPPPAAPPVEPAPPPPWRPDTEAAPEPRPAAAPPEAPPPRPPLPPPAPPKPPFELPGIETLGLWALGVLAGIAGILAVLFLLREAVVRGIFGPPARFAGGCLVAAGAWALSEVARSRKWTVPSAVLGGIGAGAAYATLWAGYARYGFLPNQVASVGMVATTIVTLLAAVRRDSVLLACMGLAGGYLTPLLLATGENKAVAFFSYLAVLDAGVAWAATRRRWWHVLAAAAVATTILYVGWAARFRAPDQVTIALAASAALGTLFLVPSARRGAGKLEVAAAFLGGSLLWLCGAGFVVPTDPFRVDPVSGMPLAWDLADTAWQAVVFVLASAVVPGLVARRAGREAGWVATALAAIVLLAFGFGWGMVDAPPWVPLAVGIAGVPALSAVANGTSAWPALLVLSGGLAAGLAATGEEVALPVVACGAVLALVGAIGGWARGPRGALVAGVLASAVPLGVAAYAGGTGEGHAGPLFAASALAYAIYAWPPFWRPRRDDLAGVSAAALAGPAFFPVFHALWSDRLGGDAIGLLPVLLGLGSLVGVVALARVVKVRADDRELAMLVAVVLLAASVAVPLQLEEAWLTVGWAIEVALLAALSRRMRHPVVRVFAAALAAVVAVRLLLNPEALRYGGGEGPILFNWTLYTWGVPAVALLVAARLWPGPAWVASAYRVVSVLLLFALVNLEVAHAFAHDDTLSFSSEDLAESMTRSVSWGAYGLVLLAVGTARGSRGTRLFGLFFAMLGAGKVFLVDLWSLSGLARVGSFAGLAVTLLLGAVALQRFVLRERKP